MSSGRVFRFAPAQEHKTNHLFVFLHGCGATAQSMIPIAFKFQARFPSAALMVPSGFDPDSMTHIISNPFGPNGKVIVPSPETLRELEAAFDEAARRASKIS